MQFFKNNRCPSFCISTLNACDVKIANTNPIQALTYISILESGSTIINLKYDCANCHSWIE